MNIWQKRKVDLFAISFYHYIVYTNIQIIIILKTKLDNSFLKKLFVKIFTTLLHHNLKGAGVFTCVSIKSFKTPFLKHACNDVYNFLTSKADSFPNQQWYEMAVYLMKCRFYNPPASKTTKPKPKNLIKLHFVNKIMDMINISKVINDKNMKKNYLHNLTKQNKIRLAIA